MHGSHVATIRPRSDHGRDGTTTLSPLSNCERWQCHNVGFGSHGVRTNNFRMEFDPSRAHAEAFTVLEKTPQEGRIKFSGRAIGAFMSHCGWNSVMESVAAGVPLLTWPLAFEQFINERLVTAVLGIGERVWEGFRSTMDKEKVVVPATTIASAVAGFFDSGGKGVAARRTAMECAKKAKAAVAVGGSSWKDLNHLIDALRAWPPARETGE
ncbi:hypothetical protein KSP40_PGU005881 [Platanthera guangdongensis]|uniref:Uncharacterized protein n=1 Tax=Platanthera guangdongensis TaxID=2320717 RepID=A0ABR2MG89_9ASPA